jgi:hypothetical protein
MQDLPSVTVGGDTLLVFSLGAVQRPAGLHSGQPDSNTAPEQNK